MKTKKANSDTLVRAISRETGRYFNGQINGEDCLAIIRALAFANELMLEKIERREHLREKRKKTV